MNKSQTIVFQNNSFDYLRHLAAFSVVALHIVTHLRLTETLFISYLLSYYQGVVVLFGISGFLIAASFEKCSTKKEFFIKRIKRLYPGLWGAFGVSFLLILFLYSPALDLKRILVWFSTQLTFLQFYTPDWLREYGNGTPNGSLWTIVVELQFYVLVGLFFNRLKSLTDKQWILVIGGSIACNILTKIAEAYLPHILFKLLFQTFIPYVYIFLIGVFIYINRERILPALCHYCWWIFILYTLIFTIYFLRSPVSIGHYTSIISGVFIPFITIAMAYRFGRHRIPFDISYGIYLYHMIFINVMLETNIEPKVLAAILVLVFTIGFAFVSYYFIEKPFTHIKLWGHHSLEDQKI
ncbi:MAG: acyltransferase [Peptococcaceae bacterium]|nr:acyltransferase [Peptococcaceae bacterium]